VLPSEAKAQQTKPCEFDHEMASPRLHTPRKTRKDQAGP